MYHLSKARVHSPSGDRIFKSQHDPLPYKMNANIYTRRSVAVPTASIKAFRGNPIEWVSQKDMSAQGPFSIVNRGHVKEKTNMEPDGKGGNQLLSSPPDLLVKDMSSWNYNSSNKNSKAYISVPVSDRNPVEGNNHPQDSLILCQQFGPLDIKERMALEENKPRNVSDTGFNKETKNMFNTRRRLTVKDHINAYENMMISKESSHDCNDSRYYYPTPPRLCYPNGDIKYKIPPPSKVNMSKDDKKALAEQIAVKSIPDTKQRDTETSPMQSTCNSRISSPLGQQQNSTMVDSSTSPLHSPMTENKVMQDTEFIKGSFQTSLASPTIRIPFVAPQRQPGSQYKHVEIEENCGSLRSLSASSRAHCGNYLSESSSLQPRTFAESDSSQRFKSGTHSSYIRSPPRHDSHILLPKISMCAVTTNDSTDIDSSNQERDSFITTSGSQAPPKYTNSCLDKHKRPFSASNVNQITNSAMVSTSKIFQRASHDLSDSMYVYNSHSLPNSTQRVNIREEPSDRIRQPAVYKSQSILDHVYMNVNHRSSRETTQSDKLTHSPEAVKSSGGAQKSVFKRPRSAVIVCKPHADSFQNRNRTSHDLKMMQRETVPLNFMKMKLKGIGESLTEDIKHEGKSDTSLLQQGSTTANPITNSNKYINSLGQNREELRKSSPLSSNSTECVQRKRSETMYAQTNWGRKSLQKFTSLSFHSDADGNIDTHLISRQSTLQPPLFKVEPDKSADSVGDQISGSRVLARRSARQRTRSGKQEQSQEVLKSRTREINSGTSSRRRDFCLLGNFRCDGQIQILTVAEMTGCFGQEIGKRVYKAKKLIQDIEVVIKTVKVTDEVYQMSFEKEISRGRILHPFILPVIARAEQPPTTSETGFSYLMFPYMKNRDLRHNIDLENDQKYLCTSQEESQKESNSRIWTRCIYQITQGLHYLHTPIKSVRGPVFHRDLTSRNIFFDENFNIKIGDFGIAAEANFSATQVTVSKVLGMEGYHPPSVNQYKYHASYDIFSLGVVILEILTGERAVLKGDPYFLHKKYICDQGMEDLVDYLDQRAEENKAASWFNKIHRNKLAEMALSMVRFNGKCKKTEDLLQTLDEMCLESRECYREPMISDRCVSCCINPQGFNCFLTLYDIAKLSLNGINCVANRTKKACHQFCLHCLMNYHINPLFCPKHGKTRPPFGDHVYGVFVAGNSVKGMEHLLKDEVQDRSFSDVANTFIKGVEKVVKVLTTKHPFVLGASSGHLKIVKPKHPGTIDEMESRIRTAFDDVNLLIKEGLEKNNLDREKDRLPNSLFIFYFSGHCSKSKGLYLGNTNEILKASTPWIKQMLHIKLQVDQILVILDCCHADSQSFDDRQWLNPDIKYPDSFLQLSSCDTYETSNSRFRGQGPESKFTYFLCQSLQGPERTRLGEDEIVCCQECDKRRQNNKEMDITLPCPRHFFQSRRDQCVKVSSIRDFIQGHFEFLRGETGSSVIRRNPKEMDISIAYYNTHKSYINIHLKGSERIRCLRSYPESMERLRQDIINYIVHQNVVCEIMLFHEIYGESCRHLIAICRKHPLEHELASLESIYKAWSLGLELEARVRGNIKGLIHGPVKLNSITRRMVTESRVYYNSDYLKLSEDSIQIPIKSFRKAEEELWEKEQSNSLIQIISQILRRIRTSGQKSDLEKKEDSVLRFYIYDTFSVLAVQ